eukprot:TRINITY_DN6_c0_g2_i17.p1 TRINITY_DN6_c0_g2~~TRINITY_DN6_c0_g2_i17.p1  ORF type:complete len:250 (-),score=28.60 TRINITY_DN6_c0_g2_i17:513-1220(-)
MTTGENECLGCRIPAAWIREGKYLHLTSGVNEQNNYYINFLVSLKTWYHVQIKQVENEAKKIVYSILVNNKVIHSLLNTKAREYKNVKVYVADPWYPAANGTFDVSFDLYINSYGGGETGNVFHMTTGENECLGCRIPAAWIREGKYLHLTSGVNEQNNYYINFLVSLKTWYHVQIKQVENEAKKIVYSILVNNKVIHSLLNTKAREYKNVKVYVTDPWYPAANGTIKNIQIITP